MYPTELEIRQQHRELVRQAEHHRLVKSLRHQSAQPSLWQRLQTQVQTLRLAAPAQPCEEVSRTAIRI